MGVGFAFCHFECELSVNFFIFIFLLHQKDLGMLFLLFLAEFSSSTMMLKSVDSRKIDAHRMKSPVGGFAH